MNKNTIFGILILFVAGFGYYGFSNRGKDVLIEEVTQSTTKNKTENYFAQNQDCLRYKDEIAKKLETKESSLGESSLEQIFYSPKVNSCVYVRYTERINGVSGFYFKNLYDVRDDGPSSRPLIQCDAVNPLALEIREFYEKQDGNLTSYYQDVVGCNDFDETLSKYK